MAKNQNCVIWVQIVSLYTYKPDDVYKDIAEDVETRFDTSRYELDKPLPKGKNKKVIGLMKNELGRNHLVCKFENYKLLRSNLT